MINEWCEGQVVSGKFLVVKCERKVSRAGKDYYDLVISDKSGKISAKIWNVALAYGLEVGQVIDIEFASVDSYNGELQISINSQVTVDEGADPSEFCRVSKFSEESMLSSLKQSLSRINDAQLKCVVDSFLTDAEFMEKFVKASAAVSVHHDYVHGLLEHTLHVVKGSEKIAGLYSWINKDLVVASAFLHDIGKLQEISSFPKNEYTLFGNCIGHVTGSAFCVWERCKQLGVKEEMTLKLVHCILAHHGQLEFGSPKVPALPEAMVISMIDNLDAKLKIMQEELEHGEFVAYNRYVGTRVGSGAVGESHQ